MTNIQLGDTIKNLPKGSGIYIFKKSNNKFLYVGKATNLKNRVGSYLKTEDQRIMKMVELARSLKFISTQSDIEALILESQLIKRFQPPFNIVMRDDKQYFYVGFTNETFPKIFITHQPYKVIGKKFKTQITNFKSNPNVLKFKIKNLNLSNQDTQYIGPFTDGATLKTTLRFLRSVFPYCTCKQPHNNFCLNYHIGKCLGYCCLKQQKWITDFASRLSTGLFNPTTDNLQLTTYKKNVGMIKNILTGKKKSVIKNLEKEMRQLAQKGELGKAIELREKLRRLKRVFENAKIIQNQNNKNYDSLIYQTAKEERALKGLQKVLKLPAPPFRVEGYDVSNIQGTHATGAMVTFIHGQPDKNFYRKFKIYTKQSPNDTAMLKEILGRRFKHEEWPFPDLILIDGGKQQLRAAEAVVNPKSKTLNPKQNSNIKTPNSKQTPIIAVTKNKKHIGEKIYVSGRKSPLPLNKLSPADKNLLLQIDSEAHRFAIGYYRKLHRKLFR